MPSNPPSASSQGLWMLEFEEGDGQWKPFECVGSTRKPEARELRRCYRRMYPFKHWRFRISRYRRVT